MNNEEMYTSLNKGIPSYYGQVEVDFGVLLRSCASDKAVLTNELRTILNNAQSMIASISGYTRAKYGLFNSYKVKTNYNDSLTSIYLSPNAFVDKLMEALDIQYLYTRYDDANLTKIMYEKVKILSNVKSASQLRLQFPVIYEDYMLAIERKKQIDDCVNGYSTTHDYAYMDRMRMLQDRYKMNGFDDKFENFISNQVKMYNSLIKNKNRICVNLNNNALSLDRFEGLDKDKFELYLAYQYMEKAISSDDVKIQQSCIYYVITYLSEAAIKTDIKNLKVKINDDETITFRKLYGRFNSFMKKNPQVKPINENRAHFYNYHGKHTENHIKKYYGNTVNWYIVSDGNGNDLRKIIESTIPKNVLSKEEKDKIMLERFKMLARKIKFYEESGSCFQIVGIGEFTGYIAYVYPNGEILMDRLYDDLFGIYPAKNSAIYNVKASDFEVLSKLNKQKLRNSGKAKVLNHTDTWEERATKIIEKTGTEIEKNKVKELKLKTSL